MYSAVLVWCPGNRVAVTVTVHVRPSLVWCSGVYMLHNPYIAGVIVEINLQTSQPRYLLFHDLNTLHITIQILFSSL